MTEYRCRFTRDGERCILPAVGVVEPDQTRRGLGPDHGGERRYCRDHHAMMGVRVEEWSPRCGAPIVVRETAWDGGSTTQIAVLRECQNRTHSDSGRCHLHRDLAVLTVEAS